uniref:Ig-like domain-containing protein n=1 Tax=Astatotilapia calliptera TaxID=8154 RepID=A0A3P8NCH8_ASTCA
STGYSSICCLGCYTINSILVIKRNVDVIIKKGDNVTLPCGIPSIKTCSSISWDMSAEFNLTDEIIKKEKPTAPSSHRYRLLKDCSLQITQLVLNDARLYTCKSGTLKSITERSLPDDTPINGSRFVIEHPRNCFSKLIIDTKSTDHHRKWRCHLTQNDLVKATISYTTTVEGATQPVHKMKDVAQYVQSVTSSPFPPDGLEEVFATVGELMCTRSFRMIVMRNNNSNYI